MMLRAQSTVVQEFKFGDWEELVDNKTWQTFYCNEELDKIQFERPKQWVTMLASQFDQVASAGRGKRTSA